MKPSGCVDACPACPHRDLSAEESLQQKECWLRAELAPWGKSIQPIKRPQQRWGYRRKSLLHARLREGAWRFGMVRMRGREEEFIPIPDCPLHHGSVNELFSLASRLTPAAWPLAFGLVSGSSLTLVLKEFRNQARVKELSAWAWPQSSSLFVNWNPVAGKRALDSRQMELVHGRAWGEENGFIYGPGAFRQQIPEMENAALSIATEFMLASPAQRVVDLYSGGGASLKRWLGLGKKTVGVELSGESVTCAIKNAPGAEILRGRVDDRLPQLDTIVQGEPFSLYTNPPRSGHGAKVLQWLQRSAPERIAYLSCHPRSLAGDLAGLTNYEVEAIHPFDFFPQTGQVENLALLKRR